MRDHTEPQTPSVAMVALVGPLWMDGTLPWTRMFTGQRDPAMHYAFLGSTAEIERDKDPIFANMPDGPGPVSRSLPLYLAEYFYFNSEAEITTLMPWDAEHSDRLFRTEPWSLEEACAYAREDDTHADYLIVSHVQAQRDPWRVHVRIIRVAEESIATEFLVNCPPGRPARLFPEMTSRITEFLQKANAFSEQEAIPAYQTPPTDSLSAYLLRLEQSLSVRCSSLDPTVRPSFSNPNDIIEGIIRLCKINPSNVPMRALLVYTLMWLAEYRPALVLPFKEMVAELWQEYPLVTSRQEPFFTALREVYPKN